MAAFPGAAGNCQRASGAWLAPAFAKAAISIVPVAVCARIAVNVPLTPLAATATGSHHVGTDAGSGPASSVSVPLGQHSGIADQSPCGRQATVATRRGCWLA